MKITRWKYSGTSNDHLLVLGLIMIGLPFVISMIPRVIPPVAVVFGSLITTQYLLTSSDYYDEYDGTANEYSTKTKWFHNGTNQQIFTINHKLLSFFCFPSYVLVLVLVPSDFPCIFFYFFSSLQLLFKSYLLILKSPHYLSLVIINIYLVWEKNIKIWQAKGKNPKNDHNRVQKRSWNH